MSFVKARTDRMKHVMSTENKRMDLILEEFDRPPVINPNAGRVVIPPAPKKQDLASDYIDLYKNFNEFNSRNNPERAQEIKVAFF